MKLAAIDIGSNAVRLLIKDTEAWQSKTDNYYERQPLKSGMDVFEGGAITPATALRLTAIIAHFGKKMKEMDVSCYRACATSAYRDATNGREVARQITEATGVKIEVISGDEEARLTRSSLVLPQEWAEDTIVISDVGGGSTELSVMCGGEVLFSHSYRVGSMRYLCHQQHPQEERLLDEQCAAIRHSYNRIHYLGAGGCIKFMCSYIHEHGDRQGRSTSEQSPVVSMPMIAVRQMEEVYADLKTRSVDSIVSHYRLPRERADILTPACSIFLRIAHGLQSSVIGVPPIGVRDGIIASLYHH